MLAIRLKRTGRSGHAQFRVIVQDSRFHPTRGRIVAYLGNYDPHTKTTQIDKDMAAKYLSTGAQPSDRVALLLKNEGVKLPDWVKVSAPKKRAIRNPEKLRRNRPEEPVAEAPAEPAAEAAEPAEATVEATEPETAPEVEAPTAGAESAAVEEAAPAEEPTAPEATEVPAENAESPTEQ